MRTDELIRAVAAGLEPVQRRAIWPRLAAGSALGFVAALVLVLALFGVRADLGDAMAPIALKSFFWLIALAVAAPAAIALLQPNVGARKVFAVAGAFLLVSAATAAISILATPPEARLQAWTMGGVPECLWRVPMLAVPVAVSLFAFARGLAPTRLTLAGAAVGALSGAAAGLAYAWFCPGDSVAYVGSWYAASLVICAALGAALGPTLLRWR